MADPKYVRLNDALSRGMRADLNSGFSIAGLDVQPMPDQDEEPRRYDYVRSELRAGRLEGASKAEYDEVHPDVLKDMGVKVERTVKVEAPPVQESHIQREARKARRKILASRDTGEAAEAALEADEERRAAAVKAQRAKGGTKASRKAAADAAALEAEQEEARQAALAEGGSPDDEDEDDSSGEQQG
jgi:hypothetical protein